MIFFITTAESYFSEETVWYYVYPIPHSDFEDFLEIRYLDYPPLKEESSSYLRKRIKIVPSARDPPYGY